MPLENTATISSQALTAQAQSGSDWKWTVVSLGIMLLVYSLGKLCIRQEIANNGRVQTSWVLPEFQNRRLNLQNLLTRQRRKTTLQTAFSLQQRLLYAHLYDTQQIIFGVILYVAGLALIIQGSTRLLDNVGYSDNIAPVFLLLAGVSVALWGVISVVRRQKHNPFATQL